MNPTWMLFVSLAVRKYATEAMAASEASEKIWSSLQRVFDREEGVYVLGICTFSKKLGEFFQLYHLSKR